MIFDVAVIGAGLVGCAVARELAGQQLAIAVLDKSNDVGDGTSKANTAILHTGFDAKPATLQARLVRPGCRLLTEYATVTGIPIERPGALLVAWTGEEFDALPGLRDRARGNDCHRCEIVDAREVYRQVPALGDGARGGLVIPDESIICPWTTNLALATDAINRGVHLLLNHRVDSVTVETDTTILHTPAGGVRARWVINAAGLGADHIDGCFGHHRFTVIPRRGELLVYDKLARPLVNKIVLPVPTSRGKGMLITPTVYGNVLLGPTAEDVIDRSDTSTSEAGLASLLKAGRRLMPRLLTYQITACYAGLRAAIDRDDYLIHADPARRYVLIAGIRSTGLTACMAIAEYVRELIMQAGLALVSKHTVPDPPRMVPARDGHIVCFCERVTVGEIRHAVRSALPPAGMPGLRRRTRVLQGRCQGTFCAGEVNELLTTHGGVIRAAHPAVQPATPDVLIIGAGPAGLAAARALAPRLIGQVVVVDRAATAGGSIRHHQPGYAHDLVTAAARAGAVLRTRATVTHWIGQHAVELATPQGRLEVHARAILLATGAYERPHPARLIPGDRPPTGVYTTSQLHHITLGARTIVAGEPSSWASALTAGHASATTVLMPAHSRVVRIIGRDQLRAVEIEQLDTGARRTIDCDTLILTGDWVPDNELAQLAGVDTDPHRHAPLVDAALRTSRSGVFAAGDLIHPATTADIAAMDGHHAAEQVLAWLRDQHIPTTSVRVRADPPFGWVTPSLLRSGDPAPAGSCLLLGTDSPIQWPHVALRQDGHTVAHQLLTEPALPGGIFRVPAPLLDYVNPCGGAVHIGLHQPRQLGNRALREHG